MGTVVPAATTPTVKAKDAWLAYRTGLPEIQAMIETQAKAGVVGKVFKGDLEKQKADFVSFLTKFNLISEDPLTQAKSRTTKANGEVDGLTGGLDTKIKAMVVDLNNQLAGKVKYEGCFYYRTIKPKAPKKPKAAPAPVAEAVANTAAPNGASAETPKKPDAKPAAAPKK